MVTNSRKSLQALSAEVANNPNSTAFVELAAAYRERGDLDRALRLCLRGLERHPTHVEAHFELGRIYEARGERELALDEWSVVQQLAPEHLPSCCASLRLYLDEGRLEDARRELEHARQMAPNDTQVRALAERLRSVQAKNGAADLGVFAAAAEEGGTLGILLIGRDGALRAGGLKGDRGSSGERLGSNLAGARAEAERVASYLELGDWAGMSIESETARFSVTPLEDGVLVVVTRADMPAGRASRVVQRARELAETGLEGESR